MPICRTYEEAKKQRDETGRKREERIEASKQKLDSFLSDEKVRKNATKDEEEDARERAVEDEEEVY